MMFKDGDLVTHISRPELVAKFVAHGDSKWDIDDHYSYILYGTKDNPIYPRGDDLDKSAVKRGCVIVNTELIKPASLAAALRALE